MYIIAIAKTYANSAAIIDVDRQIANGDIALTA
jgi:hypothetical protein